MRDFNMTHSQKVEMQRHFNFKLSFNSVSLTKDEHPREKPPALEIKHKLLNVSPIQRAPVCSQVGRASKSQNSFEYSVWIGASGA